MRLAMANRFAWLQGKGEQPARQAKACHLVAFLSFPLRPLQAVIFCFLSQPLESGGGLELRAKAPSALQRLLFLGGAWWGFET